jgi:hypothetical protein
MSDKLVKTRHKFSKNSKMARKEFEHVKDKELGRGLVKLTRTLNQIRTQVNLIADKIVKGKKHRKPHKHHRRLTR